MECLNLLPVNDYAARELRRPVEEGIPNQGA